MSDKKPHGFVFGRSESSPAPGTSTQARTPSQQSPQTQPRPQATSQGSYNILCML